MKRLRACSDAELLERSGHEPEAFTVFYRRYERLVLGYLMARVRAPELAADLAAETFASVLEKADHFDPERAGGKSATPWILAIARHALIASLKQGVVAEEARRRLGVEPLALDDEALARIEEQVSRDPRLSELLADLPDELHEAITARVLEERDYGEIAAELNCSELLVRKRVSRGLSRLRSGFLQANNS